MPKSIAQMFDPTSTLIACYSQSAISDRQQLALQLYGKLLALKTSSGTDYTSLANQVVFFQVVAQGNLSSSDWSIATEDGQMALEAGVWLLSAGSASAPASVNAALALVPVTQTKSEAELREAITFVDALLVQKIYSP